MTDLTSKNVMTPMHNQPDSHGRRKFIGKAAFTALYLSLASGFVNFKTAHANPKNWMPTVYPEKWFQAKSIAAFYEVLRSHSDFFKMPVTHQGLSLLVPQLAENGAMVNVTIRCNIPNAETMAIVVADNPSVLAACVVLGQSMHANLQTRVKMQQSGEIYALVFAENNIYYAKQTVAITLGGCGA